MFFNLLQPACVRAWVSGKFYFFKPTMCMYNAWQIQWIPGVKGLAHASLLRVWSVEAGKAVLPVQNK